MQPSLASLHTLRPGALGSEVNSSRLRFVPQREHTPMPSVPRPVVLRNLEALPLIWSTSSGVSRQTEVIVGVGRIALLGLGKLDSVLLLLPQHGITLHVGVGQGNAESFGQHGGDAVVPAPRHIKVLCRSDYRLKMLAHPYHQLIVLG